VVDVRYQTCEELVIQERNDFEGGITCVQCVYAYNFAYRYNKKAVLSQRLPRNARDHTIRQYARGLLLESLFVPSSTDCSAVRAKIRQKRPSWWP